MIRSGVFDAVHAVLSPEVVCDCIAFANSSGGYVHIGYADRQVIGLEDPETITEKIHTLLREQVTPDSFCDDVRVSAENDGGKAVAKICVPAAARSVCYLTSGGLKRGVYIREGAKTVLASAAQTAQLMDRIDDFSGDAPYLLRHSPCFHADLTVLHQYCRTHGSAAPDVRLAEKGGFLLCRDGTSTHLGYLFSDRCPLQIQIYEENGKTSENKCFEYSGPYFMQIAATLDKLKEYNPFRKDLSYALPYDYPSEAIETLVYHAVRYRDYALPGTIIFRVSEDHIEAVYPGGLLHPFELEDYMNGASYPHNPEMSKALGALGFDVLRYNDFRMITDIYDAYEVQPVYTVSGHSIRTVLPNLNRSAAVRDIPQLSAKEREVLDLIYDRIYVSRGDVEQELHFPQATAVRVLNALVNKNFIEKVGTGRATMYRHCSRTSKDTASDE